VDAQGDVRSNGTGGFMSIADLAGELKNQFPLAFKSDTPAGAGEKPGAQQRQAAPAKPADGGSALSKISAGLAKRA
jgi:hypothetical protein